MLSFTSTSLFFNRAAIQPNSAEIKITAIEETLKKAKYINPNESYTDFLLKNSIISVGETPSSMFARVATALAEAGKAYYGEAVSKKRKSFLIPYFQNSK